MIVDINKKVFNKILEDILKTKEFTDSKNSKLDISQKKQIHEMKAFFEAISNEDFLNYSNVKYNEQQGILFLEKKLRYLGTYGLLNESQDSIKKTIKNIYNCFGLVFPRDRFANYRSLADKISQSIVLNTQEFVAEKLLNALGLTTKDQKYNENKSIMLQVLANKENIENITKDVEYITRRIQDAKSNLNTSEIAFNKEREELLEKLIKENDNYKTELSRNTDDNFTELQKSIQEQRIAIKNTIRQITVLQDRLSRIDQNVYREELAIYFLKEHDALKGKIEPISLFASVIVTIGTSQALFNLLSQFISEFNLITKIAVCFSLFILISWFYDLLLKKIDSKKRKINIKNIINILTPYWCWLFATLAGMGSILYKAVELSDIIKASLADNTQPLNSVLPYFGIYVILVWFTWFSSKQFSYTKQICDEYEYKYALSKSYIIYKNEAENVITEHSSNAVLLALLDSVIKNIAHSPVQSVKQDVHTPFSEVLKTAKDSVKISEHERNI